MEKKMETTIMVLYRVEGGGFRRDGEENGDYYYGFYQDYSKDPFLHS